MIGAILEISSVLPTNLTRGTRQRTLEVAEWTAKVSHNHPEGIKVI